MKRHQDRLPFFWMEATVTSVFNGGLSATVEINRVIGRRYEEIARELDGKTAIFEGDNLKPAQEIRLDEERRFVVLENQTAGHRFTADLEIAVLVEFSKKGYGSGEVDLGLFVRGWHLKQVFQPLYRRLCKLNAAHFAAIDAARQRSEREKFLPYQIVEKGKVLVTESLNTLADYFERRAFPEGENISYRALIGGKFQQLTSAPAMLPKPNDHGTGVQIGRKPEFPQLEHLLQLVKEIEPVVEGGPRHEDEAADYLHKPGEGLVGLASAFESAEEEKNGKPKPKPAGEKPQLPRLPKKKVGQGTQRDRKRRPHQEPPQVRRELAEAA